MAHTENIGIGPRYIKLKSMRGCHELELSGYLDEFMQRERRGKACMQGRPLIIALEV